MASSANCSLWLNSLTKAAWGLEGTLFPLLGPVQRKLATTVNILTDVQSSHMLEDGIWKLVQSCWNSLDTDRKGLRMSWEVRANYVLSLILVSEPLWTCVGPTPEGSRGLWVWPGYFSPHGLSLREVRQRAVEMPATPQNPKPRPRLTVKSGEGAHYVLFISVLMGHSPSFPPGFL